MGWKGYESTIPLGYSSRMPGKGNTLGMSSYYDVTYIYCCPSCGLETIYDDQCVVAKQQKFLKKKILNEND